MTGRIFFLYAAGMIGAFVLGEIAASRSHPSPSIRDLDAATWYPWFSSAAKMEMINAARENHVDPQVIDQMIRRANYWEEPFAKTGESK